MSTLKERIAAVLETNRFRSMRAWSQAAGVGDAVVEKLTKREGANDGKVQLDTLIALADAAGVSRVWFILGLNDLSAPNEKPSEDETMSAGTFLLKLRKQPELQEAIEENPGRWKLSTVSQALRLGELQHDTLVAGQERVSGGGWAKILDDVEAGKYAPGAARKGANAATTRQVGPRPKIPRAR